MKLLDEITQALCDGNSELTNALLKTKALLYFLGRKDLVPWVDQELNGYKESSDLPDYRCVPNRILVNINNGYKSLKSFDLPLGHLSDDDHQKWTTSPIKLSISQIEHLLSNTSREGSGSITQPIPLEIAYTWLGSSLNEDFEITSCFKSTSTHYFTSILTQVRSRLLDFILELSEQLSSIPESGSAEDKLGTLNVEKLFNNAVFGDNTTINLGHGNTLTIKAQVNKGDIHSLKNTLAENGLSDEDVSELESAIKEDGAPTNSGEYGSSVSKWFSKIVSKAAENGLTIGISTTIELVTEALKKYYGF